MLTYVFFGFCIFLFMLAMCILPIWWGTRTQRKENRNFLRDYQASIQEQLEKETGTETRFPAFSTGPSKTYYTPSSSVSYPEKK